LNLASLRGNVLFGFWLYWGRISSKHPDFEPAELLRFTCGDTNLASRSQPYLAPPLGFLLVDPTTSEKSATFPDFYVSHSIVRG
jgi:hypothetical protein